MLEKQKLGREIRVVRPALGLLVTRSAAMNSVKHCIANVCELMCMVSGR